MWPSSPHGHAEFVSNKTVRRHGTNRERIIAMTVFTESKFSIVEKQTSIAEE